MLDSRTGRPTRPAHDPQLAPRTCDVCGPLDLGVDPVRLDGPAGDVVLCLDCVERLIDVTPRQ